MKNKNYKYYQPNDKDTKDKYGDCVIRALTKVLCKDWLTVFDELYHMPKNYSVCQTSGDVMKSIYSIMALLIRVSAIEKGLNDQLLRAFQRITNRAVTL